MPRRGRSWSGGSRGSRGGCTGICPRWPAPGCCCVGCCVRRGARSSRERMQAAPKRLHLGRAGGADGRQHGGVRLAQALGRRARLPHQRLLMLWRRQTLPPRGWRGLDWLGAGGSCVGRHAVTWLGRNHLGGDTGASEAQPRHRRCTRPQPRARPLQLVGRHLEKQLLYTLVTAQSF